MAQQPTPPSLRGAVDLSALTRPRREPTPGAPAQGSVPKGGAPSLVVEGTDANFSGILELSSKVPVIVELYAGTPSASLVSLINELGGRFVLATVDTAANPQLVAAFQAVAAPTVAAVIAGRPVALYEGEMPVEQVQGVLDQVAQLAAQNGVTGSIDVAQAAGGVSGDQPAEAAEEPLPPLHQQAFDAISEGDYDAAITAYRTALAQSPRDTLASAGLAQVSLLKRVQHFDAGAVRTKAAELSTEVAPQLDVADLDVAGGHIDDAFTRLLELYPSADAAGRDSIRVRLLEYFEIVGAEDERVATARRALTTLLY
ncbi:MAG: tetratricopeptide repeat protein [Cryobacterium sp.]|nr:tetratricopeptide repeat protein [Cryobacterium sp.]